MANNSNIEKAFLGCLVKDHSLLGKAIKQINGKDLVSPEGKSLYRMLNDIHKNDGVYDSVTIKDYTPKSIHGYIKECLQYGVKPHNMQLYMHKIKDTVLKSELEQYFNTNPFADPSANFGDTLIELGRMIENNKIKRVGVGNDFNMDLSLESVMKQLHEARFNPGAKLLTGIHEFDDRFGGLKKKRLYVVGSRPAHGKTSLLVTIAYNIILTQKKADLFTLEMSKEDTLTRLISMVSGLNNQLLENPEKLTDGDWACIQRAIEKISKYNLNIYDTMIHISDMEAQIAKSNSDIVFIDFAQQIKFRNNKQWRENISEATADLEHFAIKYDKCIVLASQLSRTMENENREPTLRDLKESGGLEENAWSVFLLYWPYKVSQSTNPKTKMPWTIEEKREVTFIHAKNRSGDIGKLKLNYVFENYMFRGNDGFRFGL